MTLGTNRLRIGILLICTIAFIPSAQANLVYLKQLVNTKQFEKAYQHSQTILIEEEGNTTFDFLFGIAAVETGHVQEAIFPLERVLIEHPNNHRARLELARAHFILGDKPAAKTHFEQVKEEQPPPGVVDTIDAFLKAVEVKKKKEGINWVRYIGATVGKDSNVNSATASDTIVTPTLTLALAEGVKKLSDAYSELEGGVIVQVPLTQQYSILGMVQAKDNFKTKHTDFSQATFSIMTGVQGTYEHDMFRIPVQFQKIFLANKVFRHSYTLGSEWTHLFSKNKTTTLFAMIGKNQYTSAPLQTATTMTLGASVNLPIVENKLQSQLTTMYNRERATNEYHGRHNGKNLIGLTAKLTYNITEKVGLSGSYGIQHSRYADTHPVFLQQRTDRTHSLDMNIDVQLTDHLSMSNKVNYSRNKSNTAIYDYNRTAFSLGLKYQW